MIPQPPPPFPYPLGATPEQVGIEVRAGQREQCSATAELNGRVWRCHAARHDAVPGTAYGQADSHRWVPDPRD